MPEQEKYLKAWKGYKRNVRTLWVLIVGFFPLACSVIKPLINVYQSDLPMTFFGLAWLITLFYLSIRIGLFKCPRCGELFFEKCILGRFVGFYTNKCVHCGLQKYSLGNSLDFYSGA